MTAINICLQEDRAFILTDSLFVDMWEGEPQFFEEKCYMVPGRRMAVAVRGDWRVPEGVATELPGYYSDIDGVLADKADKIRDLYERWVLSLNGDLEFAAVEIYVVGWSDRDDVPKVVVLHLGKKGWQFNDFTSDGGAQGPLLSDLEINRLKMLGHNFDELDIKTISPEVEGLALMEAQRRMKLPLNGKPTHCVGGHVLLTELRRDGYKQAVIHTWPDEEGLPVKPEPFGGKDGKVVELAMPNNMSRQQRRAWERQNRKVTA